MPCSRCRLPAAPLPNEGVPNCRGSAIGMKKTTANQSGNATIDLSDLADGEYEAVFRAPDASDASDGAKLSARSFKKQSGGHWTGK